MDSLETRASLESVRNQLIDHLGEALDYEDEMDKLSQINDERDFFLKVCDAFFNLITDPTKTPENIIHLLDTYTSGLDGFSTNMSFQTLVAFVCLEALAIRRPEKLSGPWETLAWFIVKYSAFANTSIGNELCDFRENNQAVVELIIDFGSPELCPNPCLRLELFRFMKTYDTNVFNRDLITFQENVMSTLCELCNYTSLTIDQIPNVTPMELQYLMEESRISIAYIIHTDDSMYKQSEMISAVIKLTRNIVLLEEKHKRLANHKKVLDSWQIGIKKHFYACLSFCGLIYLSGDDVEVNRCLNRFVEAVGNDSLLQNLVIDTFDTVKQFSYSFSCIMIIDLQELVRRVKDKLFHKFVKGHIKQLPTSRYMQEINGGISPAVEYRLRCFQNNMLKHYHDYRKDIMEYSDLPDGAIDLSGIASEYDLTHEPSIRPFSNCFYK